VRNVPTHVSILRHVAITFYLVHVCAVLTVHSLYRHQLHGTVCLHIFVVVPLCRSFYLNSSLTFSSPLSLLSRQLSTYGSLIMTYLCLKLCKLGMDWRWRKLLKALKNGNRTETAVFCEIQSETELDFVKWKLSQH